MARKPAGLVAAASAKPQSQSETAREEHTSRRAGRDGKKMIAAWFDVEVSIELGILAKRKQTTVQDLVGQGIDYVFRSNGMPEIAGGKRDRVVEDVA